MFPSSPPPVPGIVHTDVRVDRVRWHVATAGEGPAIVLLHGWPQHWWVWRRIMPELARTHRVYAPDLRGFGWSEAPEGRYGKMGLACDVERLLDVLEIESCTLVGHDWGGFISFLTAFRAPRRIERVVAFSIMHPWLKPSRDPRTALIVGSYQIPLATPRAGEWLQRLAPIWTRTILQTGSGPGFEWAPEDVRLYVEAWRRPAHARAAAALYRTFLTRELQPLTRGHYAKRRLEMPVLLATGAHDPVVKPGSLGGYEGNAPRMRTAVIEDAGHFVADEQPRRVLELIQGQLA